MSGARFPTSSAGRFTTTVSSYYWNYLRFTDIMVLTVFQPILQGVYVGPELCFSNSVSFYQRMENARGYEIFIEFSYTGSRGGSNLD